MEELPTSLSPRLHALPKELVLDCQNPNMVAVLGGIEWSITTLLCRDRERRAYLPQVVYIPLVVGMLEPRILLAGRDRLQTSVSKYPEPQTQSSRHPFIGCAKLHNTSTYYPSWGRTSYARPHFAAPFSGFELCRLERNPTSPGTLRTWVAGGVMG